MTDYNSTIDSRLVARKLISWHTKRASTLFLLALLQACKEVPDTKEVAPHEQINDSDRAELSRLIDEVA